MARVGAEDVTDASLDPVQRLRLLQGLDSEASRSAWRKML